MTTNVIKQTTLSTPSTRHFSLPFKKIGIGIGVLALFVLAINAPKLGMALIVAIAIISLCQFVISWNNLSFDFDLGEDFMAQIIDDLEGNNR